MRPATEKSNSYTPTDSSLQQPKESARYRRGFRLLSDGFVLSSRTITRTTSGAACLLLFASITCAQAKPLPAAPNPNGKIFAAGISLLAAAKTADAITTRQLLDRGGWENDPVFGRHPSPTKQAGINLAFFAGESAVFYLTEHNRHAWIRWTGRAILAYSIVEHSQAAACNAGINTHVPGVQNCGPLVF